MGKFTSYGDDVDEVIGGHMDILRTEITRTLKDDLISIVLTGGFARGEGSVEIRNGKIEPLNDYDLLVITQKPIPDRVLNTISTAATQKMNIDATFSFTESDHVIKFYTDIRNMTLTELKAVMPLIKYYEMKYSGKVIYGKDVLNLIPDINVEDIPLQDGMRFLFNRMSLLIEYFRPRFLKGQISLEEKKSVIFFAAKAFHSCCEALLLFSRRFVPSYKERATIFQKTYQPDFPELYAKIMDLDDKISLYTDFKLKPEYEDLDAVTTWFEAREAIGIVTRYYLEKALGMQSIGGWIEFSKNFHREMRWRYLQSYISYHFKNRMGWNISEGSTLTLLAYLGQIYMNWIYFTKTRRLTSKHHFPVFTDLTDPGLKLYSSLPLILFSISKTGQINRTMLHEAVKYLQKVYPPPSIHKDDVGFFEDVSDYYTNAFRIYQFLKV